jgi:hypothetical protein
LPAEGLDGTVSCRTGNGKQAIPILLHPCAYSARRDDYRLCKIYKRTSCRCSDYGEESSLRDQTRESQAMHFRTTRTLSLPGPAARKSDRAFATSDETGSRRSLAKRDAVDQRGKAWRDLESSRMDSTLRRHTLLVAAILAPLRRFDT